MKKIGIYPGNFQPAARSHYEVYKRFKAMIGGDEVFVVTTDREPIPEAPLNFGDKEQIWVRHGVPASHIVKVTSLPTDDAENVDKWRPEEIFHKFSAKHTAALISLNPKDASLFSKRKGKSDGKSDGMSAGSKKEIKEIYEELARHSVEGESPEEEDPDDVDFTFAKQNLQHEEPHKDVWLNTEGKPSYFQPYKGNEHALRPLEEHSYIVIVDDTKIEGNPISTTNIRNVLGSDKYTDNQKKKFFRWVFGWFDVGLYQLMSFKFRNARQLISTGDEPPTPSSSRRGMDVTQPQPATHQKEPEAQSKIYNPNRKLQEIVYGILKELMDEDYSTDINTPDSSDNMTSMSTSTDVTKSPAQQKSDVAKQRQDLVAQKKELEAKSKQNKQQRDSYSTTVKNYDSIQKKQDRDALDSVNKQLSAPVPPTPMG